MPRKKAVNTNKSTTCDDITTLETEAKRLKEARKNLARERRLTSKEQFLAIPRRGRIGPGEVMTIEEVVATWGYADIRKCEKAMRKRGIPIDDDDDLPQGLKLVSTTLLIEKQEEYMRCRYGSGSDDCQA